MREGFRDVGQVMQDQQQVRAGNLNKSVQVRSQIRPAKTINLVPFSEMIVYSNIFLIPTDTPLND